MNFNIPGLKYRKFVVLLCTLSGLRVFESLIVYLQKCSLHLFYLNVSSIFTSVPPALLYL